MEDVKKIEHDLNIIWFRSFQVRVNILKFNKGDRSGPNVGSESLGKPVTGSHVN